MKKMHWTSIIGLAAFIIGTVLSLIGTYKSNEATENRLSAEIKHKNDKIDSLAKKLDLKEKEIATLKQWNNKISIRLLDQVHSRIEPLFNTIISYSSYSNNIRIENLNEELITQLCKSCDLDRKINAFKRLSTNPLVYGEMIVREDLLNNWSFVCRYLDEITFASTYIHPQVYELALRIKKSSFALTIGILSDPATNNKNLESWSSAFYQLYILDLELKELIKKLNIEENNS